MLILLALAYGMGYGCPLKSYISISAPAAGGALLLESGDYILLEIGDKILLEA